MVELNLTGTLGSIYENVSNDMYGNTPTGYSSAHNSQDNAAKSMNCECKSFRQSSNK